MPAEIAPVVAEVGESLTNLESTLDAYLALSAGEVCFGAESNHHHRPCAACGDSKSGGPGFPPAHLSAHPPLTCTRVALAQMSQRDAAKKDLATAYSAVSLLWSWSQSCSCPLQSLPLLLTTPPPINTISPQCTCHPKA